MQPIQRNYRRQEELQTPQQPLLKQRRVHLAFGILTTIVIIFFMFQLKSNNSDSEVLANSTTSNASEVQKPKQVVDTTNLQNSLEVILKKYPAYDTSVSVVEINSDKTIQAGDSYPFVAASTTKLLTALLFLNNVENGQDSLKTNFNGVSAQELLRKMINESDNNAWAQLNDSLTKESLAAYAKKQGLTSYDAEKNTITSNDMAQLIAKVYNGKLINEQHTALLYSWMQKTSEERFIPPAVPPSTQLYHKAGYLKDRVHDVAIIDNGATPYVVVIYSKTYGNAAYDYAMGQKLFSEVIKQTLETFNTRG